MQEKESLIFERSRAGRRGSILPSVDKAIEDTSPRLSDTVMRSDIEGFPEVSEPDVIRHFHRLSQWNYSIDEGLYPLGSCTMKYNPRINEHLSRLPAFTQSHPLLPEEAIQGSLKVMWHLSELLKKITGFAGCTLSPAAGAHGEFTGMLMIKAYHEAKGNKNKNVIIIPDSAHGTNPSSSILAGFKTLPLASGEDGRVHIEELKKVINEETAGIMLTNPNTLGLFETDIGVMAELIHSVDGLVYCDGANFNAVMGQYAPAKMGIDVMHLNLHKSFSTPHGGGGPGSGPVLVGEKLLPFLPSPQIAKREEDNTCYFADMPPRSVGEIKHFYGNFGVLLRAYVYLLALGGRYLPSVSELAVLNANYCQAKLQDAFDIPFKRFFSMHETILSDGKQGDVSSTLNIAKALIDCGYHPPTIYFPLIVHGAMMIEPTETESKQTLDEFIEVMKGIAEKIKEGEDFSSAPLKAPVKRLDEATAARKPILHYKKEE